jgi:hypothetical protein
MFDIICMSCIWFIIVYIIIENRGYEEGQNDTVPSHSIVSHQIKLNVCDDEHFIRTAIVTTCSSAFKCDKSKRIFMVS